MWKAIMIFLEMLMSSLYSYIILLHSFSICSVHYDHMKWGCSKQDGIIRNTYKHIFLKYLPVNLRILDWYVYLNLICLKRCEMKQTCPNRIISICFSQIKGPLVPLDRSCQTLTETLGRECLSEYSHRTCYSSTKQFHDHSRLHWCRKKIGVIVFDKKPF